MVYKQQDRFNFPVSRSSENRIKLFFEWGILFENSHSFYVTLSPFIRPIDFHRLLVYRDADSIE